MGYLEPGRVSTPPLILPLLAQDPSFRVWKHNSYTQYAVHRSMLHFGLSYVAFTRALLSVAVRRFGPAAAGSSSSSDAAQSRAGAAEDPAAPVHASALTDDVALRLLLLHLVLPLACRLGILPSVDAAFLAPAPEEEEEEGEEEGGKQDGVRYAEGEVNPEGRWGNDDDSGPPGAADAAPDGETPEAPPQPTPAPPEAAVGAAPNEPSALGAPLPVSSPLSVPRPMPPLSGMNLFGQQREAGGAAERAEADCQPQTTQADAADSNERDGDDEESGGGGVGSAAGQPPSTPAPEASHEQGAEERPTAADAQASSSADNAAPPASSLRRPPIPVYTAALTSDDEGEDETAPGEDSTIQYPPGKPVVAGGGVEEEGEERVGEDSAFAPEELCIAHARESIARTLQGLVVCGVPLAATPPSLPEPGQRSVSFRDVDERTTGESPTGRPVPLSCDTCARDTGVGAAVSPRSRSPSPSYAAPTASSTNKRNSPNAPPDFPGVVLFGPGRSLSPRQQQQQGGHSVGSVSPTASASGTMRSPSHQETLRRATRSPRSQASAQVGARPPPRGNHVVQLPLHATQIPARYKPLVESAVDDERGSFTLQGSPRRMRHAALPLPPGSTMSTAALVAAGAVRVLVRRLPTIRRREWRAASCPYPRAGASRARQRDADAALAEQAARAQADASLGLGRPGPQREDAFKPYGSRAAPELEFVAASVTSLLPELVRTASWWCAAATVATLRALLLCFVPQDAVTEDGDAAARSRLVDDLNSPAALATTRARQSLLEAAAASAARLAQPRSRRDMSPAASPRSSLPSSRALPSPGFAAPRSARSGDASSRGGSAGPRADSYTLTPPAGAPVRQGQGASAMQAALSAGLLPGGDLQQQRPSWLPKTSKTGRRPVTSALNSPVAGLMRRSMRRPANAAASSSRAVPVSSVHIFDSSDIAEDQQQQYQQQQQQQLEREPDSQRSLGVDTARVYEFVSLQRAQEMALPPTSPTLQPQHHAADEEAFPVAGFEPSRDHSSSVADAALQPVDGRGSSAGFEPLRDTQSGGLNVTPAALLIAAQQPEAAHPQQQPYPEFAVPQVSPVEPMLAPGVEGSVDALAPPHPVSSAASRHIGWASALLTPQPTRGPRVHGRSTTHPPSSVISGSIAQEVNAPHVSEGGRDATDAPVSPPEHRSTAAHGGATERGLPTTERKQQAWVRRYEAADAVPAFAIMLGEGSDDAARRASLAVSEGNAADFPNFESPPHASRSAAGGDRSSGHQPYLDTPAMMRAGDGGEAGRSGRPEPPAGSASQAVTAAASGPPRPQSVVHITIDAGGVHVTSSSGPSSNADDGGDGASDVRSLLPSTEAGLSLPGRHVGSGGDGSTRHEGAHRMPPSHHTAGLARLTEGLPPLAPSAHDGSSGAGSMATLAPQQQQQQQSGPVETTMRVHRSGSVDITTRPATPAAMLPHLPPRPSDQQQQQQQHLLPLPREPSPGVLALEAAPGALLLDELPLEARPTGAPAAAAPLAPPHYDDTALLPESSHAPATPGDDAGLHSLAKSPRAPVHPPPVPPTGRTPPQASAPPAATASAALLGGMMTAKPRSPGASASLAAVEAAAAAAAAAAHAAAAVSQEASRALAHAATLHRGSSASGLGPVDASIGSRPARRGELAPRGGGASLAHRSPVATAAALATAASAAAPASSAAAPPALGLASAPHADLLASRHTPPKLGGAAPASAPPPPAAAYAPPARALPLGGAGTVRELLAAAASLPSAPGLLAELVAAESEGGDFGGSEAGRAPPLPGDIARRASSSAYSSSAPPLPPPPASGAQGVVAARPAKDGRPQPKGAFTRAAAPVSEDPLPSSAVFVPPAAAAAAAPEPLRAPPAPPRADAAAAAIRALVSPPPATGVHAAAPASWDDDAPAAAAAPPLPDVQAQQQQQQAEVWAASELLRALLPDPLSASSAAVAWHAELLRGPSPAPQQQSSAALLHSSELVWPAAAAGPDAASGPVASARRHSRQPPHSLSAAAQSPALGPAMTPSLRRPSEGASGSVLAPASGGIPVPRPRLPARHPQP